MADKNYTPISTLNCFILKTKHHFHILNAHISVLSFRKDMCSLSHALLKSYILIKIFKLKKL